MELNWYIEPQIFQDGDWLARLWIQGGRHWWCSKSFRIPCGGGGFEYLTRVGDDQGGIYNNSAQMPHYPSIFYVVLLVFSSGMICTRSHLMYSRILSMYVYVDIHTIYTYIISVHTHGKNTGVSYSNNKRCTVERITFIVFHDHVSFLNQIDTAYMIYRSNAIYEVLRFCLQTLAHAWFPEGC